MRLKDAQCIWRDKEHGLDQVGLALPLSPSPGPRLRLALYLELQAAQVSGEKAILGAHRERFPAGCKCSAGFKTGTSEVRFLLLSCLRKRECNFPPHLHVLFQDSLINYRKRSFKCHVQTEK